MKKEELISKVREEIRKFAYECLRDNSKESVSPKKIEVSEQDIDNDVFNGGMFPEKENIGGSLVTIKEGYENGLPKINSSDVSEFEGSFDSMLQEIGGASVIFDTQSNGYSLMMSINNKDGIEAGASGIIDLGSSGRVSWSYSLKNGLNINTENLRVESSNKDFLSSIFNHYNSWQKDWREKLTIKPGHEEPELDQEDVSVEPSVQDIGQEGGQEGGQQG